MTKFVAVALADTASEHGDCWPSNATLAMKCGCTKRTVQNAVDTLIGMGLLRRVHRVDSSNIYQFVLDNMPMMERKPSPKEGGSLFDHLTREGFTPEGMKEIHPPVKDIHPTRESPSPRTVNRTQSEPSLFSGSLALPDDVPSDELIIDSVTGKWNEVAEKHPHMQACRLPLDAARKRLILARSKQLSEAQPTVQDLWSYFFERIDNSPFLQGRSRPSRDRDKPFTLSLTWALKAANFTKIMEKAYEGTGHELNGTAPDGRTMGAAEQATRGALEARRAARERSRAG